MNANYKEYRFSDLIEEVEERNISLEYGSMNLFHFYRQIMDLNLEVQLYRTGVKLIRLNRSFLVLENLQTTVLFRVFRDECLNVNYFTSLSEAKEIIESWRLDYNEKRPQKGLKELSPSQFKT
ncbi:hypothetical protein DYE49_09495 [Treponema rectale]|uniref:Transposase InsO family protein n=1 Tax=Treponema rectale TaxID=744512 RepID=A0A840SH33_9SPIR|nr:transposase InsO family protein [Treponema rectale]QOS40676.1 hypothetical protein DYE49_09495 [Treponema rectale]